MAEIDEVLAAITQLLRLMIRYPESMVSQISEDRGQYVIAVTLDTEDVGRVIGVGGRNARSFRVLLAAVGTMQGRRYWLSITESGAAGRKQAKLVSKR